MDEAGRGSGQDERYGRAVFRRLSPHFEDFV